MTTRRQGWALVVVTTLGLACVAAPAPARAAGVPSFITVVQDGEISLRAHDEDEGMCLELVIGRDAESSSCPGGTDEGVVVESEAPGGGRLVGAAVTAAAATIEVRRAGVLLGTAATVAGEAYRGRRAGSVRFALLRLPAGTRTDGLRVRALDAAGQVREVLAGFEPPLVSERRTLLSGRSGTVRWRLALERASKPTPTVANLDQEAVTRCVRATVIAGGGAFANPSCLGDAPADMLIGDFADAETQERCKPGFRLLHGVVAGAAVKVSVLRGDGRRVTARTARLLDGAYTAYAYVVPAHLAVRSVRVQPRGGRPRVIARGLPPLPVACGLGLAGDLGGLASLSLYGPPDAFAVVAPAGPVTTVPGVPAFRLADGPGGSLCLALGDRPFTLLGCDIVAPGFGDLNAVVDDATNPRALVLALPARVAAVRISRIGAAPRDIATVPAEGYAGPYAGKVRFAAIAFADPRELQRMVLLGADGAILHTETSNATGPEPSVRNLPLRRAAGQVGRASLWQSAFRFGNRTTTCLSLTDGPPPPADGPCQALREADVAVLLRASCATRRLTVAVTASAGDRASVTTSGGRVSAIRLRRGAGLLTLPRSSGLRSLTVVQRSGRARTLRLAVRAPSAAGQCGWHAGATP